MKLRLLFAVLLGASLFAAAPATKIGGSGTTKVGGSGKTQVAAAAVSTPLITAQTVGALRNNITAELGMKITVGGASLSVTHVGRWVISGNSGTHTLRIVRVSDEVEMASTSVNTSGAAVGEYLYATLGSPVTLAASTAYYVLSGETNAGDQFRDIDTTVTATAAATVDSGAYYLSSTYYTFGSAGTSYGPVNIKY